MRAVAYLALVLLLALPAAAPRAQTRHNSNAPIDFGADHIELQDQRQPRGARGQRLGAQAEMTLNAARMTVAYTGEVVGGSPQVSRLDASRRRHRGAPGPDRAQPLCASTTSTAGSSRCSAA